ncbi:hypothetical protein [Stenotrophomonas muris]|uniref:hypothetical protein n=1 Tax=Stenotrophomonas muris TaxID=2963283 RepID=UPI00300F030A
MREHPILFNGAMVRAILAGKKTQTRRLCKDMNAWVDQSCREVRHVDGVPHHFLIGAQAPIEELRCPLGKPGDRLWVRETWRPQTVHSCAMDTCDCDSIGVTFAADGKWVLHTWSQDPVPDSWYLPDAAARGNLPSIHMPRWACRLVLEITEVRVERLQAISPADALAEGAMAWAGEQDTPVRDLDTGDERIAFSALWGSTGGDWNSNPWVWVITFKRIEA